MLSLPRRAAGYLASSVELPGKGTDERRPAAGPASYFPTRREGPQFAELGTKIEHELRAAVWARFSSRNFASKCKGLPHSIMTSYWKQKGFMFHFMRQRDSGV
jgi:hypothetical protein